jgi:hypothetical protein
MEIEAVLILVFLVFYLYLIWAYGLEISRATQSIWCGHGSLAVSTRKSTRSRPAVRTAPVMSAIQQLRLHDAE